jgi:hypothetical protein
VTWLLPMAVIDIEVTWQLVNCGTRSTDLTPRFEISAAITPRTQPDPSLRVALPLDDFRRWRSSTDLAIEWHPDGTLKRIGFVGADATGAVLGNLLRGATAIVGMVVSRGTSAGAPPTAASPLCSAQAVAALTALETIRRREHSQEPSADERARLRDAASALRRSLTVTRNFRVPPNQLLGPVGNFLIGPDKADAERWFADPEAIYAGGAGLPEIDRNVVLPDGDTGTVPRHLTVEIRIRIPGASVPSGPARPPASPPMPQLLTGVWVREAAMARIEVRVPNDNGVPLAEATGVAVPQSGRLMRLSTRPRVFERLDWGVSFAPDGRMQAITLKGEARLVGATAALAESAERLAALSREVATSRAAQPDPELAALERERRLLEARLEVQRLREAAQASSVR